MTDHPKPAPDPKPAQPPGQAPAAPARAGLVLTALILGAGVANLNLAVANVALPDIGKAFDASQTQLNMIAVGFSLGLAASVLYLGAIGDRYGRKLLLMLGLALTVPACIAAAYAPSAQFLAVARIFGGLAAGMAYPTTLALITALWGDGPDRTRAIALWSAIGGGLSALGPLMSGLLLSTFWWGSVFLVSAPFALIVLVLVARTVPAHVNETDEPVDNLGGVLSVILVGSLVVAINFASVPGSRTLVLVLSGVFLGSSVAFYLRQRVAPNPLYDLTVASRRIFWVAAVAGMIVFGSLMGAMFIGQQFLQNVLGYSTVAAGFSVLPSTIFMVLVAGLSAKMVNGRGSRLTLLVGFVFILAAFLVMLFIWDQGSPYWHIGLAYALIGVGVGLAGTPSSHSLTGSVPVTRVGMASGTADLQRDLGGAVMQSILGALLTMGYATAMGAALTSSPQGEQVTDATQAALTKSFAGAADVAEQYPQYASQIVAAARESFLSGDKLAYAAGAVAVIAGAVLVALAFPNKRRELELLDSYAQADAASVAPSDPPAADAR